MFPLTFQIAQDFILYSLWVALVGIALGITGTVKVIQWTQPKIKMHQ